MIRRLGSRIAVVGAVAAIGACAVPAPAQALNVAKPVCTIGGLLSGVVGKLCTAASHGSTLLSAGKKLFGGHLGGAVHAILGSGVAKTVGLAGVVAWVSGGAAFALRGTAALISWSTRPELQSTWFSAYYWRMAAIAALLTLPFLFAACIQALMRSDLAMLVRSALIYLPLGFLAVAIAAPLTALLLSAADELSALISSASGGADASFLAKASLLTAGISAVSHSAFFGFFIALLTVFATVTLWVELLIRSAAVYVIVMMLPLFFAALVWPARRIWALRAVEMLVAVILSKFAIVAVLSLGGAALGHTLIPGPAAELEGATLILLAAFSPWALLRLLPLHELAAGLDGLRAQAQHVPRELDRATGATETAREHIRQLLPAPARPAEPAPDEDRGASAAVAGLPDEPDQPPAERQPPPAEPPAEHAAPAAEHGPPPDEPREAADEPAPAARDDRGPLKLPSYDVLDLRSAARGGPPQGEAQ